MKFDDFIKKWDGKFCEVAGSANAKNQCVDLANAYIREVLELPIIEWTDAKNFPSRASPTNYDWIPNKGLIVPQVGDLVIWSTNHIGICTFADIDLPWFTSFDQNWPTGSVSHKVDHSYTSVSGWLRPKGGNMPDEQIIKQSDAWIGILTYLEITKDSPTLDDAKNVVAGIKARANDMEKQKGQWEAKYNSAKDTISTLEAQLLEADKAEKACQTALNEAERNLKEARGQIAGMIEEKEKLASDLAELKAKRSYDELLRIRRYFVAKYK